MSEFKNIREAHEALKNKKISATELTSDYLTRAKKSQTNSFITLNEEGALAQAKNIDQKISAGETLHELAGIPLGIKDVFLTKGVRSTAGSKFLKDYVPFTESTVTTRLLNAGAINIGKLNMDEFAMGSNNEFSAYGVCKNPWNLNHVPGGSSGGSGASVAEGSSLIATGSDTGGSIRLPAHYCGVAGIKPSYGRCSRYGMFAFASSLDQAGTMARNVYDAALGLEVMMGHDSRDSTCIQEEAPKLTSALKKSSPNDLKKLTIGIPDNLSKMGLSTGVANAMNRTIEELKKAGAKFKEVKLPMTEEGIAVYYIVAVSEASSNLSRYDGVRYTTRAKNFADINELYSKSRGEGFGEEVKRRIILGAFALSAGYYDAYYIKACKVRRTIANDFQKAFEATDIILSPVATRTATKIGEQVNDPLEMYMNDLFTIPVSLAGLPTMSIPIGFCKDNLPVGIQIIGKYKDEVGMVSAAYQMEQLLGFENILERRK